MEAMGIPVTQIPHPNDPECLVNKVTDTDIEEVETSIAKTDDNDAFDGIHKSYWPESHSTQDRSMWKLMLFAWEP
jgi:hypothetical protein